MNYQACSQGLGEIVIRDASPAFHHIRDVMKITASAGRHSIEELLMLISATCLAGRASTWMETF
jgi:hypothetical protein